MYSSAQKSRAALLLACVSLFTFTVWKFTAGPVHSVPLASNPSEVLPAGAATVAGDVPHFTKTHSLPTTVKTETGCNHDHSGSCADPNALQVDLPLDFLDRIVKDNSVAFELPDGRKIGTTSPQVEADEKGVLMVSGTFTEPSSGTFFFRRQDFPGVAGKMVGNVIFTDQKTAWKVLPEGKNGDPILKEVPVGEVICVGYAPPEEMPQDHTSNVALPEYQDVIPLQSLPGAPGVIYLDFDGSKGPHETWSYKGDAAPSGFSNSTIRDIWFRVAEDYLPFNLNVTTDARVYEDATRGRRIRCIITPNNWYSAGGVAYVGSYNWSGDPVCWAMNYTGDSAVTVITHEVGHTLGLYHHGYSTNEYYGGHGSGVTAWAPIMGSGYGKSLKQWSRGDYYLATKPNQNDLTTISNQNGVDYRTDDCGDTLATARYLAIAPGNTVTNQQGIIERTGEIDAFLFKSTGGAANLTVSTATIAPNLDILAEIVNAGTGSVVTSSNPATTLSASISATLPAGEYLLKVRGAGFGTPTTSQNGYSNYGCLGSYKIEGTVAGGETYLAFPIAEHSPNGTVLGTVTPRTLSGGPFSYVIASGNTGNLLALNASTGSLTVANSSGLNYETLSTQYDDPATLELFVTITNPITAASETVRAVVTVSDVNESPVITSWANVRIFEGTAAGTHVVEISATDPDRFDGPTYSIFSGNEAGYFTINSRTGLITLVNAPDVTVDTPISLVVRAADQKTPVLFSSQTLTLTIISLSDSFTGTLGGLYRTFFKNISGSNVADLTSSANFPNAPDQETYLSSFDGGSNQGDNYGSTFCGYLLPPTTGTYKFWVAADNSSQLILGADATPVSTPIIASCGTVNPYAWDQTTVQASANVTLTAGQPYYIELRHKESTYGDHAAVAWSGPGITRQVISGLYLAPFYQNYAPRLSGALTVAQNAVVNKVVGKPTVTEVNAQDTLSGYAITAGNTGNLFAINASTGEIKVAIAGQFNPSAKPYYDLTIRVSDDGTPVLTGTGVVRVTIQPSDMYFDPNGTTAGSVVNGGSYTWLSSSWAGVPGGTSATQAWASGADAFFAASTPTGLLSYSVSIADYNTATHGGFGAIEALAGTVKFTGNVGNFYLSSPLEVKTAAGAAIEFNQTCTSNALLAFNLNSQTATFDGNVTFNNCGIGNTGNIVLGSGLLTLRQPNSYTGTTTLLGGVLNVASLSHYGVAGGLGNRAAASEASGNIGLLFRGGTLQYTGNTAQSTDRQIRIGTEGGTIDASGSTSAATVAFTYSAANTDFYNSPGDRTLTLTGSNTGANTFAIRLTDQNATTGQTSLVKTGTGTWVLAGENTHTGGTTIEGGTLQFNSPTSLPGTVQVNADSNDETLFGTLFMNAGNTTWPQAVSGSGLWKVATGSGTQTTALTGSYSGFSGTLEVAAGSGKIQLATAANYPAAGSTLQMNLNTSGFISGGGTFSGSIKLLGGSIGEPTYGQLRIANANPTTLTGSITLQADSTIAVDSLRAATINGVIGESGGNFGFTKNQAGTLTLGAANTYTGGTKVSAGILQTGTTTGNFGPGNLTVENSATCIIQHTTGTLGRQAYVYLNGTGKLNLATGVSESIARLYIGGVQQAPGTYSAENLASNLSGGGSLIVGDVTPTAPTELTAGLPAWNTIQLSWKHVSINETGIKLERSLSPTSGFAEIATLAANATGYADGGLPVNTTYYYRVRVGNAVGYSPYSSVATATTGVSNPPLGFTASASSGVVSLSWTLNPSAASYNLKRSTASGGPYSLLSNTTATTYTDTAVTNGTPYFYVVTSAAAGEESLPSDEVSARPLPPAGNGTWADSSGGNWSDVDNWLNFVIADGIGNSATFNQSGGGSITLDTTGRSLSSLNFSGGNYSLLGNPFTLDVITGSPVITVGTGRTASLTAALAGADGLTKSGAGTLSLTNSTYTGSTTIITGKLSLLGNYISNSYSIATGTILDFDTSAGEKNHPATQFTGAGTLRKSGANRAYWGTAATTFALDSGALIDVQGGTLTGGSNSNEVWTGNKADLAIASGATFDGVEANVRVDAISGSGSLKTGYNGGGYANLTVGVDNGSSTFSGIIANSSSTGNLAKEGTGTITLSGNNTFTGSVAIKLGALRLTRSGGLGSGTKIVSINAENVDKILELDGTSGNITLPSSISFQTSAANGVIRNIAGNNTVAGAFTMTAGNGNTKIISDGGALTLTGNFTANTSSRVLELSGTSTEANTFSGALYKSNTPALSKIGAGTWTLSGPSTFEGQTTVTEGTLKLAHNNALGSTVAGTTVSPEAKLQLEGTNLNIPENLVLGPVAGTTGVTIENLSGNNTLSGTITRNRPLYFLSNAGKLTIQSPIGGTNNTVNLQGDGDGEMSGAITVAYALNKTGNGTWTLSGASTYTTATNINAGKIILSGSLASPITATTTGILAPQGAPTTTGSLTVTSTGNLEVRPGDVLNVGGAVTLAGNLNIIAPPGLTVGTSFTILNKTGAGAISGTFIGKTQGSTFTASDYLWQISYTGGNGNDVIITLQPSSAADAWRQFHFGMTANTGVAADSADPNSDGESNLLEFATGQNPHSATRALNSVIKTLNGLEFTYSRNKAAFDEGYRFNVEYSDTLSAPWTSISTDTVIIDGATQTVRVMIPFSALNCRFVRLKVGTASN